MAMPRLDLSSGTKRCPDCNTTLPLERFNRSNSTIHGYSVICKECAYQRHKAWTKKNPGYSAKKHRAGRKKDPKRYKDYDLKKAYGMPPGTYTKMYAEQNGKCAICRRNDPGQMGRHSFHVDHCHSTNTVRGLLCHNCNVGLGHFQHDETLMLEAIEYLRRFPTSQTPR